MCLRHLLFMKKLILIPVLVTLLLSFDAFSQKIPHMTQIDKQELRYMDNSYISILAWQEYMYYTKEKYGQGSKEYLSIIPNIEEFNKHYNGKYSIVKIKDTYTFNPEKGFNKKRENFPIVGLSISQKEGYCKWRTEVFKYEYYQNVRGTWQSDVSICLVHEADSPRKRSKI